MRIFEENIPRSGKDFVNFVNVDAKPLNKFLSWYQGIF